MDINRDINSDRISKYPNVIFSPPANILVLSDEEYNTISPLTTNLPIPSAYYYYTTTSGDIIAMPNTIGSDEEKINSLRIWYSMTNKDVFPVETAYVRSSQEQIGKNIVVPSILSLSLKDKLRQYPQSIDWLFSDHLQILIGLLKITTISDILYDIYKFPLHQSANIYEAAKLVSDYSSTGDETDIRKYLDKHGVVHLENHSLNYYPPYPLFFLLTRFACPPLKYSQLVLAHKRNDTKPGDPERILIDSVFEYDIPNLDAVIEFLDLGRKIGFSQLGYTLGTIWPDWVRWGDEYVLVLNKMWSRPDLGIYLYAMTDIDLHQLSTKLGIELPFRDQYPSRYPWVDAFASLIKRYFPNRIFMDENGNFNII